MDDSVLEIDELFGLEITELRYRGGVSRNAGGAALTSAAFTIVSDDTTRWSLSTTQPSNTVAEGSRFTSYDYIRRTLADPCRPTDRGSSGVKLGWRGCQDGLGAADIAVV